MDINVLCRVQQQQYQEVTVRHSRNMKEEEPNQHNHQPAQVRCPECQKEMPQPEIRQHILTCSKYIPTYLNNVRRLVDQMSPNYMQFLIEEMDIIKDDLQKKMTAKQQPNNRPPVTTIKKIAPKPKIEEKPIPKPNDIQKPKESAQIKVQQKYQQKQLPKKKGVDATISLGDLYGTNDPFRAPQPEAEKITCADPSCTMPVEMNDIEKFTYLDECLHTMCKYCFRNYVRNNYIKKDGQLNCPSKGCGTQISVYQIQQIMDPIVFAKLDTELNSKFMSQLAACQKCGEKFQFQKGKPTDAPKQTAEGKAVTNSMAKHYADNRFQCPSCRADQCKSCKEMPYHLGFNCADFQEHKLKKKCRYCREVLPKGYQSDTGIHAFDDICQAPDCVLQMKQACSKKLACGHNCFGVIRQKNCFPCLKEPCALIKTQELRGQNENSFCSLCYVETLAQSPCVRSKCGHIFHLKCLRKRVELKWSTPRINFRFCECPLCNQWMEVPEQATITKSLQTFRKLFLKIEEKALKRLSYEGENKDKRITDPTSPYYKNQTKYAMAIYAYFECYECHEPYFGGRKNCAQAMNESKEGEKFNPKQLICPSCCPVQASDCKKHGKQFISFKCRFCCSVAQWFCWGNTHFCDLCHKKQVSGEFVSRLTKDKLPKCEGKGICPVGGEHGGNGDQFCLGCGICRGQKLDAKDF